MGDCTDSDIDIVNPRGEHRSTGLLYCSEASWGGKLDCYRAFSIALMRCRPSMRIAPAADRLTSLLLREGHVGDVLHQRVRLW